MKKALLSASGRIFNRNSKENTMRHFTKFCAILLSAMFCCTMTACKNTYEETEPIDPTRTQLYVYNFTGGYGSEWINSIKKSYEELHKDDRYEEGKKGIQIYITGKKVAASDMVDQILDNREEIYFTEHAYYYTLKAANVLGDITDAVTADLESYGDKPGTQIVDKLTDEQKAFYGLNENGETRYYGLPHYAGYTGFVYNVDLFDERGYYYRDNPDVTASSPIEDYFTYYKTDKKSAGPDGKYDTLDDGLPTTYEEFFRLCEYISNSGETPVIWNGANNKDYLNHLTQALATDYEGLDRMMLNYNLGNAEMNTADDLGVISNGKFVKDASPTTITESNKTEVFRQAGKYNALSFMQKLLTTDRYHGSRVFNSAYSHMEAQQEFLYAGHKAKINPIAMLVDGIWWESEATETFKDMADSQGGNFSKMNRKFAFMPLPNADDKAGDTKNTLIDHLFSLCFMKANIAEWKKPIAYDFLKFVHSDARLADYTIITNTPKAFRYEMTPDQMNQMSYFGRSVMKLRQESDIVYPYATNRSYANNQSKFHDNNMFFTKCDKEYQWVLEGLVEGKKSAEDYFSGMVKYYQTYWNF